MSCGGRVKTAHGTAERLMRGLGIKDAIRGKKVFAPRPDTSLPCPADKMNRLSVADRPRKLWVSGYIYVPTWSGTVYLAPRHCARTIGFSGSITDVFARRIVGWRSSTSM